MDYTSSTHNTLNIVHHNTDTTFNEFLHELKEKDIAISFTKGKLQYSGPEHHIDDTLLANLKKFKSKLLKHFWPNDCWNMMPINTEGHLTPLILLHAGPSNYPISEYLGKERPYYGFFYIGSEGEKIRYKKLEDFAGEYLRQLQNIVPEGPYLLGGLSIGGHLSYEMAINLQKQGHNVPLLILVDCSLSETDTQLSDSSLRKKVYEDMKKIYYGIYDLTWKIIFKVMASMHDRIPKNQRNKYIRWTYKELLKKYNPTEEFKGDILLFKAKENRSENPYLGWDKVCKNIEVITFDGDHGAMYKNAESVDLIKRKIDEWIKKHEWSKTGNNNKIASAG